VRTFVNDVMYPQHKNKSVYDVCASITLLQGTKEDMMQNQQNEMDFQSKIQDVHGNQ
jgi:hypothetical protein